MKLRESNTASSRLVLGRTGEIPENNALGRVQHELAPEGPVVRRALVCPRNQVLRCDPGKTERCQLLQICTRARISCHSIDNSISLPLRRLQERINVCPWTKSPYQTPANRRPPLAVQSEAALEFLGGKWGAGLEISAQRAYNVSRCGICRKLNRFKVFQPDPNVVPIRLRSKKSGFLA